MDIASLKLFVLAAEKLNISAAGKQLGIAPAVASARLAKLERALGTELLHRSTRKVSLSQDGAAFLPYAQEMLAQEGAARAALGLDNGSPSGVVRFAAPSSFAQLYIAPILPEFLGRFPEVRLDLRLSDHQADLIDGSFDLALRNAALEDTSLKCRKLADDKRVLCASPSYIRQYGMPCHPNELSQHKLIGFQGQAPRQLIGLDGAHAQFDPSSANCQLVIDDGTAQRLATIAGAGISANSLWSVSAEIRDGSLSRILPDYDVEDQTALWLIYPKSNVLTAKVRVLMDFLLEKIGKAPPWAQPKMSGH